MYLPSSIFVNANYIIQIKLYKSNRGFMKMFIQWTNTSNQSDIYNESMSREIFMDNRNLSIVKTIDCEKQAITKATVSWQYLLATRGCRQLKVPHEFRRKLNDAVAQGESSQSMYPSVETRNYLRRGVH